MEVQGQGPGRACLRHYPGVCVFGPSRCREAQATGGLCSLLLMHPPAGVSRQYRLCACVHVFGHVVLHLHCRCSLCGGQVGSDWLVGGWVGGCSSTCDLGGYMVTRRLLTFVGACCYCNCICAPGGGCFYFQLNHLCLLGWGFGSPVWARCSACVPMIGACRLHPSAATRMRVLLACQP